MELVPAVNYLCCDVNGASLVHGHVSACCNCQVDEPVHYCGCIITGVVNIVANSGENESPFAPAVAMLTPHPPGRGKDRAAGTSARATTVNNSDRLIRNCGDACSCRAVLVASKVGEEEDEMGEELVCTVRVEKILLCAFCEERRMTVYVI
jgi:hypothetical protein